MRGKKVYFVGIVFILVITIGLVIRLKISKADENMCYLVENLQATNIKSTSVRLEWEYDRDVKRYWIFRQDDNGDFIVTKTITSHSAGVSVYNQGGYEVFAVVADKNEKKDRKNIIIYNW